MRQRETYFKRLQLEGTGGASLVAQMVKNCLTFCNTLYCFVKT